MSRVPARTGEDCRYVPGLPRLAGFVLAGGESRRMGRDKALLEIDGRPLVAQIGSLVKEAAGSAAIVGDPRRYGGLGFPVIPDRIAGLGPLGGLLTALEERRADWNLIVACDMPGLKANTLAHLVRKIEDSGAARAIVPVSVRGEEPLCALYHRECLAQVSRAIADKSLRMKDLTAKLDAVWVSGFDAGVFDNVNRPADWSAYIASS